MTRVDAVKLWWWGFPIAEIAKLYWVDVRQVEAVLFARVG